MEEINKLKERLNDKDKEIEILDQENEGLLEKIENLLMLIKQEEYLSQVLEDKTEELQKHFTDMQPYMILCNKTFTKLASGNNLRKVKSYRSENFYENQNKKKFRIQRLIADCEINILNQRDDYQESVKKLKNDHIISSLLNEKFIKKCYELEKKIKEDIPELGHFFTHERYDDEDSEIGEENSKNREEEPSVIYFDTEIKETFRDFKRDTGDSGVSGVFYREEYHKFGREDPEYNDFDDERLMMDNVTKIKDYLHFNKKERFEVG